MDIIVTTTDIELGWNEDLNEEEFTVDFEFDLKGDHYVGEYVYCAGNEYESVRSVEVFLDGVSQYGPGRYDETTKEWIEYTETYLSRVMHEDYWHEEYIYAVLNPIWEARVQATKTALARAVAKTVTVTTDEEI